MNLSNLDSFVFSTLPIFKDDLKKFIEKNDFLNLKHFHLLNIKNTGNVFKQLIEKNLTKLETLKLNRIG